VTRWAYEKIAQNSYRTFTYRGKRVAKKLGYFCHFQRTAQSKQSPNRQKFSQSGHSAQKDALLRMLSVHSPYIHFKHVKEIEERLCNQNKVNELCTNRAAFAYIPFFRCRELCKLRGNCKIVQSYICRRMLIFFRNTQPMYTVSLCCMFYSAGTVSTNICT
jgi:hypothetical protein